MALAGYVESATSHESNQLWRPNTVVLVAKSAEQLPWSCTKGFTAMTAIPGSLLRAAVLGQLSMALNLAGRKDR